MSLIRRKKEYWFMDVCHRTSTFEIWQLWKLFFA